MLLDTHLLLWAAEGDRRLPAAASLLISDIENELVFSVASLWEIVIKQGKERSNLRVEPRVLRINLLENQYEELPIKNEHVFHVGSLPKIHADPFDRVLIAQATVEGITLLTTDPVVARYPGAIQKA